MSENDRYYVHKMAELRAYRRVNRPLHGQFDELLAFVRICEDRWDSRSWTESNRRSGDDGDRQR
jgi:hypothetical protein